MTMHEMFRNCTKLESLNIKGFVFNEDLVATNMFYNTPSDINIKVGSEEAKSFVMELLPVTATVEVA